MNTLRLLLIAYVASASVAASAEEAPKNSALGPSPTDNVAQDVGSFAPLEFFLQKAVLDERGTPFGAVADILVDPYSAMATTLLVKPRTPRGEAWQQIPFNLVTPVKRGTLRARAGIEKIFGGPTWPSQQRSLSRTDAEAPFTYFDLPHIWKAAPLVRKAKRKDDDVLITASTLRGRPVQNTNGQEGGKITDIMISLDNGKIAYLVLSVESDSSSLGHRTVRYPVPLAAFVAQPKSNTWLLETPPGFLKGMEPMEFGKPPAGVALAWERYVDERYGGGMLSGVQRPRQENTGDSTSSH